jgi:hypothetical protein
MTFALLSKNDVPIRQDKEATRMLKSGRKSGDGKPVGHARLLIRKGHDHGAAGNYGAGLRWRQILGFDRDLFSYFLLG